jgi:hypothetical protein
MGSMSASDAAPLPRLGEVFFDVRGESRSMRLSWYADTGVAVFSIWQGGTCTGTFRLPIADLPRMVDALQYGPRGRPEGPAEAGTARPASHRHGAAPAPPPDSDIATGATAVYLPPGAEVTGYHMEPPSPAPGRGYPDPRPGRATGSPAAPPSTGDYRPTHGRESAGGGSGDYPLPPLPPEFAPDRPAGYASGPGPGGYSGQPPDGFGREPGHGYPAGPGGPLAAGDYGDGLPAAQHYGDERQAGPGGYGEAGYYDHGSGGYPADPGTGGYPSYPEEAGYSGGPGYSDAPGYSDGPGYSDAPGHRDYPEEYPSYPPGEPHPGYPPGQPYPDYPGEPTAGAPARPYVTGPGADDAGHVDGGQTEPRKPRGRRAARAAPESFPHGPPPAGRGSRQPEGYPGQ